MVIDTLSNPAVIRLWRDVPDRVEEEVRPGRQAYVEGTVPSNGAEHRPKAWCAPARPTR